MKNKLYSQLANINNARIKLNRGLYANPELITSYLVKREKQVTKQLKKYNAVMKQD
jgi:hypothetical protein